MSIIIMERLASYQMQYGWVKDQRTPFSAATKQSTKFWTVIYFILSWFNIKYIGTGICDQSNIYHIRNCFQISKDCYMGKIYIPLPLFWIGSIEHNNRM